MSTALKTIHDQLMELQPEGASHPADCLICVGEVASDPTSTDGGSVSDKTYTEAEYNSLAAQVADLEGKLTELSAAAEASKVDEQVAAVKAEMETQVADLRSKLDAAVLEAEAAKKNHEELVALLVKAESEAVEAAEQAARKESRLAQVKEVASFPESYLEENADRFAAMSDETFEVALEGFKAQQEALAAAGASKSDDIPVATAMTAARTTTDKGSNPLSEVLGLRFAGIDPRTI